MSGNDPMAHMEHEINESHLTSGPAQSPFLPGTNIRFAWDSTCLGALKTCPRLYQYQYVDFWGHTGESVHLRFGSEYHQALQDYDQSRAAGIPHNDAVFDVVKALLIRTADYAPDPLSKPGKYKSRAMLIRAVIWYLDAHRDDPAKTYIKADGKAAVELSFRFELDWGPRWGRDLNGNPAHVVAYLASGKVVESSTQPYLLCGHLDSVKELNGSLFVMDHKTAMTTLGDYYFDQWSPSNQMTLYSVASKVILDAPVKGVIINAAQLMLDFDKTGEPGARFVRGLTYRTPDQLNEWLGDLRYWLDAAEHYATSGHFPMNDTACDKFGGCKFRSICSKSPQVREQFLRSDFVKLEEKDQWNPLKSR